MLRRAFPALTLLCWSGIAAANAVVDAAGRTVQVPDHIARMLPAGPPAAVLLAALAPDLMLGWPEPLSPDARAYLPAEVANLPQVPRLTGHADVTADIAALHPDLIVDYGTVSPRYSDLARAAQQSVRYGHALDASGLRFGWVEEPPSINRLLGLAWLGGGDPATLAALFNAVVYGRVLSPAQIDSLAGSAHSLPQ
jgi:hypothetical protein